MHSKHSDLSPKGCRALGIDFGTKRIGMAVSDSTNTLAAPLKTLIRREGKRPPYACMLETVTDYDVCQLVVGLPLSLDGKENKWCAEVRLMGDKLGRKIGADVAYVDERMTSVQAERAVYASGLPRSKRREKGRIDAAAAQLILQAWLDNPGIAR
ncbi:MAG TPA: Holliday junction resolvase RuvX [Gemmatimonadetes bacterium]|jgi:putative Holliday junction resolvase|nr:Holliday junction resolvase RuvX [Gemmatimonadaceae bacterium]HAY77763.1 Holliday junction resolvase RuvX [Gemmatimonadota bacterium]